MVPSKTETQTPIETPNSKRKAFLLRVPADLIEELRGWAEGEYRSMNAQIEFVLRDALNRRG